MRYDTDRLVFSPSDLIVYLEGGFASWMDHWYVECRNGNDAITNELGLPLGVVLEGVAGVPDEQDDQMQLIAAKGIEHETAFLRRLREEGHDVAEIGEGLPPKRQVELTVEAMQRGAEFVYQGRLEDEQFAGFADFLVRQPGTSGLGDHHYEVCDTKLARSVKPYFIVQLCSYTDMLEAIQGRLPDNFSVVLGNGDQERSPVRDFLYYFRSLRRSFLIFHENFSPEGVSTSRPIPQPRAVVHIRGEIPGGDRSSESSGQHHSYADQERRSRRDRYVDEIGENEEEVRVSPRSADPGPTEGSGPPANGVARERETAI